MNQRIRRLVKNIEAAGTEFVVYLPCNKLVPLLDELQKSPVRLVPVGNENEVFGVSAGLYAAGRKSMTLIQDAGLANAINTFLSLIRVYGIPLVVFVSDETKQEAEIEPKYYLSQKMKKIMQGWSKDGTIRLVTESKVSATDLFDTSRDRPFVILV